MYVDLLLLFLLSHFFFRNRTFEGKNVYWRQLFHSNYFWWKYISLLQALKMFFPLIKSPSFNILSIWNCNNYLDYCNLTALVSRYLGFVGIDMEIQTVGFSQTLQKNTFAGTSRTQFSDFITLVSGTVGGDCTGSYDFPQLGGV